MRLLILKAMTDEPLYDPDQMVFEDLDTSDPDVVDAYLNHPTTEKLTDDLGRQFRRSDPTYQRRILNEQLSHREDDRTKAAETLQGLALGAPLRQPLQQLLDGLDNHIEAIKLRLLELDD